MLSAFIIKMLNIVNKLFGSESKRHLKSFSKTIAKINEFETSIHNLFNGTDSVNSKSKIINEILNSEIINECYIKAQNYCNDSKKLLERLPNSEEKESLNLLLDYVIERKQ